MENKLPVKYKESLFSKIKKIFSNAFRKNIVVIPKHHEVVKKNKFEMNANDYILDKMKAESNRVKIKEDILTLIEKNPELIKTLSIESLKELESMYDEIIEKNERKIKQLKREIA